MKLIYCCEKMKEAVQSGFISFSPTTVVCVFETGAVASMYCGGWGFCFCPFCGEAMDSEIPK